MGHQARDEVVCLPVVASKAWKETAVREMEDSCGSMARVAKRVVKRRVVDLKAAGRKTAAAAPSWCSGRTWWAIVVFATTYDSVRRRCSTASRTAPEQLSSLRPSPNVV
jgi:hypothetical protein